jgi:hypothetical protein
MAEYTLTPEEKERLNRQHRRALQVKKLNRMDIRIHKQKEKIVKK